MNNKLAHTLLAILALLCIGLTASAQGFQEVETHRDEKGRVVHSYLTNQWYDNWAFSVSGGIQTMISEGDLKTMRITPAADLSITKWFTPEIAGRAGWQGLNLEENYTPYNWNHYFVKTNDARTRCYYNQMYLHADLLLSATNVFLGYSSDRFVNVNPYVHFGYLRLSHPDYSYFTDVYRDREIAAGFGVNTMMKVTNTMAAVFDYRCSLYPGRFHNNSAGATIVANHVLTAGISYTIYKWYWTRSDVIEESRDNAIAAMKAAEKEEEKAKAQLLEERIKRDSLVIHIENLEYERNLYLQDTIIINGSLNSRYPKDDELMNRIEKAEMVLYYDINQSKLGPMEQMRLEDYVQKVCRRDPMHIFYITGSADEGTGTSSLNARLAKERAAGIKKILVRKYGVPEGQVVIKATIISHEHEDGRFDRCVLLESQ